MERLRKLGREERKLFPLDSRWSNGSKRSIRIEKGVEEEEEEEMEKVENDKRGKWIVVVVVVQYSFV